MTSPHSLLLITYWYPPAVGAAAERIASFARGLHERDWRVTVLTCGEPGESAPATPGNGPEMIRVPDPLAAPPADPRAQFEDYDPRGRRGPIAGRARDLVFPDRFLHWRHAATRAARKIIRSRGVDLLLVSFPPASAVMTALDCLRASRIPLVLDLRDRWFGEGGYAPTRAAARSRFEALERDAIRRSAAIVTVSEAMAEAVVAEHDVPPQRVWVIPNGFDDREGAAGAGETADLPDETATDACLIAHVGSVIARNKPERFLESLARLHRAGRLSDSRFLFVGNLSSSYVASLGLGDVVRSTGLIDRPRAGAYMRRASVLLLLTGAYVGRWGYSAKLFEYLAAGRPIVCLEEEKGSNDRLLLESLAADRCFFARLGDDDSTRDALSRACALAGRHPQTMPSLPGLERYGRSLLARGLSDRLAALIEGPPQAIHFERP